MREWASRLDLVSPRDVSRLRQRHTEDSLRALPLVLAAPLGFCLDVGSGAGFPGIPLAIASGRRWRLLEPRRRRAAFLEQALRELALDDCEVVSLTAEQAAGVADFRRNHAFVTARALAPPVRTIELCRPLVAPVGKLAIFVGAGTEIPLDAEEVLPGVITIGGDAC